VVASRSRKSGFFRESDRSGYTGNVTPRWCVIYTGGFPRGRGLAQLADTLQGRLVDLVISDMSPNISGIGLSDQARSMHLVELAMDFAVQSLETRRGFSGKSVPRGGF